MQFIKHIYIEIFVKCLVTLVINCWLYFCHSSVRLVVVCCTDITAGYCSCSSSAGIRREKIMISKLRDNYIISTLYE